MQTTLNEPDVPTIQDIQDQIQPRIDEIQVAIDKVNDALAEREKLKRQRIIEFADKVGKASKSRDDAEVERLTNEHQTYLATDQKEGQALLADMALLKAEKQDLEDQKAALCSQLGMNE